MNGVLRSARRSSILLAAIALMLGQPTASQAQESVPCTPEPTVMTLTYGAVIECESTAGDVDSFRFAGAIGETVTIVTARLTAGGYPCIELFDPAAVRVAGPACDGIPATGRIDRRLTTAGTYTIQVSTTGPVTYGLTLERTSPASPAATAMTFGDTLNGAINPGVDLDLFTFTGAAGESVAIIAGTQGGSFASYPCLELFDPAGTRLVGPLCNGIGSSSRIDRRLDVAGTYTIVSSVDEFSGFVSFGLSLERVAPPAPTAPTILFGERVTNDITPVGDLDSYTFNGVAGDAITALINRLTGPLGSYPCVELFGPNGVRLAGPACGGIPPSPLHATLTASGPHVLLVSGGIVTYALDLQCIGQCPPPPPTITITAPTTDPVFTAPGAAITLEGTATGAIASIAWSTDRGYSGRVSGRAPWYANEVPLVTGINVVTVTVTDTAGATASDTLTVTVTTLSYFLAEGATGPFFDLDLALANPNSVTAPVAITWFKEDGLTVTQDLTLAPTSSRILRVDQIAGLENAAMSTVVTSTTGVPLIVERTMRWSDAGQYGSHTERATTTTARRWYFAEGSQGFFFTYLLLANPSSAANRATVDWLREGAPAIQRVYNLAPNSRTTVDAGADAELVNRSFGIVVTFDQPAAAERAMYFGAEPLFTAGHESAGVNGPSTDWFLAEGATGPFFETFILLANPNASAVTATLTFLPAVGQPVQRQVTIPANGRQTVNLEALTPAAPTLANVGVATAVVATLPIVVERAQYWPFAAPGWYEAHNSFGVTAAATRWGLAEGRVGSQAGLAGDYQTYILLANPGATAASATLTFLRPDGTTVTRTFPVGATSRVNVAVTGPGSAVPELVNETFGTVIVSDQPIVVERALYASVNGQIFAAGTNATATRLP